MTSYKLFIVALLCTLVGHAQSFTKTKSENIAIGTAELLSLETDYAHVALEPIQGSTVTLEATMHIEGLSEADAEAYFRSWHLGITPNNEILKIEVEQHYEGKDAWERQGYYEGYFLDAKSLAALTDDASDLPSSKQSDKVASNTVATEGDTFDTKAYIDRGDAYLKEWQTTNKEPIGKRWFQKTKEERRALVQAMKPRKNKKKNKNKQGKKPSKTKHKGLKTKIKKNAKIKEKQRPSVQVRPLKKRALIQQSLKIGVPEGMQIQLEMQHGALVLKPGIINMNADLKYVLVKAKTIEGEATKIKADFSNFEIDHWKSGYLEANFSDYVLIDKADSIGIHSEASTVSIDTVTKSIRANGHFKMLSIDLEPSVSIAEIAVEDSKEVWLKVPKSDTSYSLNYSGVRSKLLHPKYFSVHSGKENSPQIVQHQSHQPNAAQYTIKALASVMQIYDQPWDDLKVKTLKGL